MYRKVSAFDIEHTGFNRFEGDLLFAYSWTDVHSGETEVFRIPLPKYERWLKEVKKSHWHPLETEYFKREYSRHDNYIRLQEYLNDDSIVKTVHNLKHELSYLRAMGFIIPDSSKWHCTQLMSQHIMNLAPSHALDDLAYMVYKYPIDQDDALMKIVKAEKAKQKLSDKFKKHIRRIWTSNFEKVPEDLMEPYQIADVERGALLYRAFSERLFKNKKQWKDYLMDVSLLLPTIRQEEVGICLDDEKVEELIEFLQKEKIESQARINKFNGGALNAKSPKQLRDFIENKLEYELVQRTKSGKNYSTDKNVLAALLDQSGEKVLEDIMKVVAYTTGITTVKSYPTLAHPWDRVIHANHKTNAAKTGRQSVSQPNLQNIAKEKSLSRYPVPARKCFVAPEGYVLYLPDYSGIEAALIASESGEQEFIDVLLGKHKFKSTHDLSASIVYGEQWDLIEAITHGQKGIKEPEWLKNAYVTLQNDDPSNVRKQMRNGIKNFVFGTAYGGQIAKTGLGLLTLSEREKMQGYERFCERFPRVAYFTQDRVKEVRLNGFITTAFGRKLYINKSEAHTKAGNYAIQSTAAGMLKRAEIRVDSYGTFNCNNLLREVVTVHDELILMLHKSLEEKRMYILSDVSVLMEAHPEIKVPITVEFKRTETSWAEAKEIKIEKPSDWKFGTFNIGE